MQPAHPHLNHREAINFRNFVREADSDTYILLAINVATIALTCFSSSAAFGTVGAIAFTAAAILGNILDLPEEYDMYTLILKLEEFNIGHILFQVFLSSSCGAAYFQGWGSIPCLAIASFSLFLLSEG